MKAKAVAVLVIASASIVTLVGLGNVWASPPSDPLSDGTPPLMMNYQGVLTDPATGEPAPDGDYEIRFALYDSANEWGSLWTELQTVSVADGLFNVLLGSEKPLSPDHFTGTTYLGVKVGADPWLTPRQRIVSVAYAIHALEAVDSDTVDGKDASAFAATGHTHDSRYWRLTGNAGTTPGTHFLGTTDDVALELRVNGATAIRIEPQGHAPNIIAGHSGNSVTAGAQGAVIGGGRDNSVYDSHGTVGGGDGNQAGDNAGSTDDAVYATVGGGWSNSASGYISTIAGGQHNSASTERATIGGGAHNTADGSYATISGGRFNTAGDGRSTVGGGESNASDGWYSTVAGGRHNVARGNSASVGGGYDNHATADYATIGGGARSDPFDDTSGNRVTDNYGTIGGGGNNQAGDDAGSTEDAMYATISGGRSNTAGKRYASVGGGDANAASGQYATVPGGQSNTAQGNYSLAAGYQANALHDSAFVWSDSSTYVEYSSDADHQFRARASGGVYFHSNPFASAGVYLAPGGTSWQAASDRTIKENYAPADGEDILVRLASLPISTWNLKSQDPSIRHIGPVAQDFYAAFGFGESEMAINMEDSGGVALTAIQTLYYRFQEQATRIETLEEENTALRRRLDDLEALVTALASQADGGAR